MNNKSETCAAQKEISDSETEPDVMLDSGSTITVGHDLRLFTDIRELVEKVIMETNGGNTNVTHEGHWIGYGDAYYHPNAIMNIVSVSDAVKKGFHVFFDSEVENVFYVTNKKGVTIRFPCNEDGLYIKEKVKNHVNATTIEGFTSRQIARAKLARKLYHNLHAETAPNLKVWLRSNMGKNVPVSCEDVDLMVRIFGKDVATLKGKSTKPHPPVVDKNDFIDLPPELKVKGMEIELAVDVVYINDQSFLHSVDRTIKFRGLSHLGTRKKGKNYTLDILKEGIANVIRYYNRGGIIITVIHADGEFKSMKEELEDDFQCDTNFLLLGEHVPDIERANRVLQERFRVALYRGPYMIIPRAMIVRLALRVSRHYNYFPAKTGISLHYSTATIISSKQVDYKKELEFSFGDYGQANYDHQFTNNNLPRTIDCIYLQRAESWQKGHEIMDLATGEVITRPRFDKCVMTKMVIRRVEEMAAAQGYKTLKFFNRKKQEMILSDIDLLEGVGGFSEHIIQDRATEVNLPSGDPMPGGLLNEIAENNESAEDVDQEQLADLAGDDQDPYAATIPAIENDEVPPDNEGGADDEDESGRPDCDEIFEGEDTQDENIPELESEDGGSVQNVLLRSSRQSRLPERYNPTTGQSYAQYEASFNLLTQDIKEDNVLQYSDDKVGVVAHSINKLRHLCMAQQFNLRKGLREFGAEGVEASKIELKQMHDRVC